MQVNVIMFYVNSIAAHKLACAKLLVTKLAINNKLTSEIFLVLIYRLLKFDFKEK